MTPELNEKELVRTMLESGLPRIYTDAAFSLLKCGEAGEQVLSWLREQEGYRMLKRGSCVVEVVSESAKAQDAFYGMARAAILRRIPTQVTHIRELLSLDGQGLDEKVLEAVLDSRALFVEGLVTYREDDITDSQKWTLEWFLSRWIMNGKALVLLHDRAIHESTLAPRFKARIREHLKFTVTNV